MNEPPPLEEIEAMLAKRPKPEPGSFIDTLAPRDRDPMPVKAPPLAAQVGDIAAGFEKLIAAAPSTEFQADLVASGEMELAERLNEIRPILVGNGWPERYVIPQPGLSGGEWMDAYKLVAPVIGDGGIAILHGKRGAGKTRMASELAKHAKFPADQSKGKAIATEQKFTAVYRTAMRIFMELRATFKKGSLKSEQDIIDALTEPGLLVIDELQERGESEWENRLLTHLIDARYGGMRSTILIANLDHAQLGPSLGPSIVDRIAENGRRIEFTWNSYRRAGR